MVNKTSKSKTELLNILRKSDNFISGQLLADKLDKSRVAIWKQIESLQESGYKIERSRKGYRLLNEPEDAIYGWIFDEKYNLSYYKLTDSTMNRASIKCKKDNKDTIVVAETQSDGRDKSNENWASENGGLFLSYATMRQYPNIYSDKLLWFITNKIAKSLTLLTDINIHTLWPNELIVNKKKLGGVLLECESSGGVNKLTTIGVGINVNNKVDLLKDAISMSEISENKSTRQSIAKRIIKNIEDSLKDISSLLNKDCKVIEKYDLSITLWDTPKQLGKTTGFIDTLGRLEININNKSLFISSGEIKEIKYSI